MKVSPERLSIKARAVADSLIRVWQNPNLSTNGKHQPAEAPLYNPHLVTTNSASFKRTVVTVSKNNNLNIRQAKADKIGLVFNSRGELKKVKGQASPLDFHNLLGAILPGARYERMQEVLKKAEHLLHYVATHP